MSPRSTDMTQIHNTHTGTTLVIGATGKTGRRVVERLALVGRVLDGRNSYVTDGVQKALGRPPRDFADYARDDATAGEWDLEGKAS